MDSKERKADEILKAFAEELTNEGAEIMTKEDDSERIIVPIKKSKQTKKYVSIACMLCIIIIAGMFSVKTADASLAEIFNYIFKHNSDNTEVVSDKNPPVKEIVEPTYIPEGYELLSETEIPEGYELMYTNDNEDLLCIVQIANDNIYTSIDSETTVSEQCFVNDSEAFYYEMEECNYLIWKSEDIYMEITAPLDKNTMIKIGESIS